MMFSTGNFRNFPIDDDVSLDSISDVMSTTLSHSITSFDVTMSDWPRDESRYAGHGPSLDSLDELIAEKPVESLTLTNAPDLCRSLTAVLNMPDLCDVTFLVGPNLVPIHGLRAVMATRSIILQALFITHESVVQIAPKKANKRGFLAKLFRKKRKEASKSNDRLVISLPEHDAVIFSSFVTYLHTGAVNITVNNLTGLLRLADIYKVEPLRAACWEFTDRCVSSQTVVHLLASAQNYTHCESISQLVDKLMHFIDRNCRRIIHAKDFLSAAPSVATAILTRPQLPVTDNDRAAVMLSWARHHHRHTPSDLPATLTRLLQCVDFSRVTNKQLRSEVAKQGVVRGIEATRRSTTRGVPLRCRKQLFTVDRRARIACSTLNKTRRESLSSGFDSASSSSS